MKELRNSLCVRYCRLRRESKGFILLELTAGLAVSAVLAAMVCVGAQGFTKNWQALQAQIELQQAGAYMQGILEKSLAYNALEITIAADNKVSYQSLLGSKSYAIYPANSGLYLRISTAAGDGVNPLFIEGVDVSGWQARRVDKRNLLLRFTLHGKRGSRNFSQLITCYNGEVHDER
ncbi:MAG: hypothetical protein Q4E64_00655 [Phascolarctobacterium sp.]|uniref:type II secretion system protein n=1 Tax=Phascolarctobacterium sp. TaxID=2049039 RepID=UPI0026DB16EC|nr:hypothetical protein [Phascolarctobacterium sp.]MDO4920330.1 hypothetical protein [Phascolarctobacterium sp.]